jgi:hypothetical protein
MIMDKPTPFDRIYQPLRFSKNSPRKREMDSTYLSSTGR